MRIAPLKTAPWQSVSERYEPNTSAFVKFVNASVAPLKLVFKRSAFSRVAPVKSALVRVALRRNALGSKTCRKDFRHTHFDR